VAREGGSLEYQDETYPVSGNTGLPDDFVRTEGTRFTIGGCDFVFAGANVWQAPELASNTQVGRGNELPGREHLANLMNAAVDNGLTVLRMWTHSVTPGRELQPEPGVYDEEIFEGLDWIIAEAGKRGLKLVFAFADNWYDVGGVPQYAQWSGTGDFFSDEAMQLYKDNMQAIATRKNSITGVAYKDDPTIMAWNLANELRATGQGSEPMQNWIEQMCGALKDVDPNHLVSIGYEGFYGPDSEHKDRNPAEWAENEGQDFVANNQVPCIDYVGFHIWPDNWDLVETSFQSDFIQGAIDTAEDEIKKPLVMEEFGKIGDPGTKDPYFKNAFDIAEQSAADGGPLRGTIFYHWYDEGIGPGKYGVWPSMSTFGLVKNHASNMEGLSSC